MEYFSDVFFKEMSNDYDEINEYLNQSNISFYLKEDGNEESKGFIGKAIDKILSIVQSLLKTVSNAISKITNKIHYMCLSKESKARYDEFVQFAKNNPSVKNKTVTVKDWKRINSEYNKVRKNILAYMDDDTVDANGLSLKAKDMIENLNLIINKSASAVSVDAALIMARQSPEAAKAVQQALQADQKMLNSIASNLGDKEAIRTQKEINKLTKMTLGRKILVQLGLKQEHDITQAMENTVNSFTSLAKTGVDVALHGVNKSNVKDVANAAVEHRTLARTGIKQYATDKNLRRGVKQIKDTVQAAKGQVQRTTDEAKYAAQHPLDYAFKKIL